LKEPIEVTVTVSVDDPPEEMLIVGELSATSKSALEVTVSRKVVV